MSFVILAFVAGVLTVLTPCFLPLLPVIIGGSASGKSLARPVWITISLAVSIFVFTLLLRVFVGLLPFTLNDWRSFSGLLIISIGLAYIFPQVWSWFSGFIGLSKETDKLLDKAGHREGWLGPVLTGLALGPAFSSCSPTYALLLVTVLPSSFWLGIVYILVYILGLSLIIFLIAFWGQYLTIKLRWSVNPDGWFRRVLGAVFVLLGVAIILGLDRELEIWLVANLPFSFTQIEQELLSRLDP